MGLLQVAPDLLALLAAAALAFAVITYVLLDGTDLGVGILFAVHRDDQSRHLMAFSILPIWDGNETWLVLAAGGLIAMFPAAYAILFSAAYVPVTVMLLALVVRGVALEYRDEVGSRRRRRVFDQALLWGSVVAAFCQGALVGAVIEGLPHDGRQFTGHGWEWLSGFSVFCGMALVAGYALMGACWMVWRLDGKVQARARRQARRLGLAALALVAIAAGLAAAGASLETDRWLQASTGLPLLAALVLLTVLYEPALRSRHDMLPLMVVLGMFLVAFLALLVALYPRLLPGLDLYQAAAPASGLGFMLVGFAILIPATLAYSTWGFWVFRGKVRPR